MKQNPIIINSSRGSIVNEKDLLRAYSEKIISGFALDVYSSEPVEEDFYKHISNSMNCILTPHNSGVTTDSLQKRQLTFFGASYQRAFS